MDREYYDMRDRERRAADEKWAVFTPCRYQQRRIQVFLQYFDSFIRFILFFKRSIAFADILDE